MKSISQLGEMALLQHIQNRLNPTRRKSSIRRNLKELVPIGDDAHVAKIPSSTRLVTTMDTLLEGTHFDFKLLKGLYPQNRQWEMIGKKSMAVNLSDLAAMGDIQPLFALLTLGVRGDISVDTVDNFYRGTQKYLKIYGFSIVGGDTIRSDKSIISICLVGKIRGSYPLTRSGAKLGDTVMLSGPLGLSSAGLEILKKHKKTLLYDENVLVQAHLAPTPKMREGRLLTKKSTKATSLIDTSDDLMTSLEILRKMSKVGFEINLNQLTVHPSLRKYSQRHKKSPHPYLLYGGEDYQLLYTTHPSKVSNIRKSIPTSHSIGIVRPYAYGIVTKYNGSPIYLKDSRYSHF